MLLPELILDHCLPKAFAKWSSTEAGITLMSSFLLSETKEVRATLVEFSGVTGGFGALTNVSGLD